LTFFKKRDHFQIIAEILSLCKSPQTETDIKRRTYTPSAVLQNLIVQLLFSNWLKIVEENYGQKKLLTTINGMIFLEKYEELRRIAGLEITVSQ
jgi:predicted transcriptional regulator